MKKLVVLGGGESGVGAAILGKQKHFDVFLSDKGKIATKYIDVLEYFEIDWEEGKHTESAILEANLIVKSPGIPDTIPIIQKIKAIGISVVSEIEFASNYTNATIIAITGSNGKTTTTMLTHHILEKEGLEVGIAGNIGDSYAKNVAAKNNALYVLEVSSFQLDGIVTFKPHIAVITNITPDHLDRYDYNIEKYIAAKFKIVMNQTKEDYLIYDADNQYINQWLQTHPIKSTLVPFSLLKNYEYGAYLVQDKIIIKTTNTYLEMSTNLLTLEGKHNIKNAMAAATVAQLLKIRKSTIRESMERFQSVPHRLEKVLKIQNVQFINDSKATNINATYYALDSMEAPVIWIVGGEDKGNNYLALMPLVREKVKAIICLGVDNTKIIEAFGGVVDFIVETKVMTEAVKIGKEVSTTGDTVLLSPTCASYDLFENYQDRGNQFKEAVRKL